MCSVHCCMLGHTDCVCLEGMSVCTGLELGKCCGCALSLDFLFFCLFSYLILCMNPSGSVSICVFVCRLLYVVGRAGIGSWTRARLVLNISFQTACVETVCCLLWWF